MKDPITDLVLDLDHDIDIEIYLDLGMNLTVSRFSRPDSDTN